MENNDFYENKFTYTQRWNPKIHLASLVYFKLARLRFFNRYVPKDKTSKILDLGCGGGNELFCTKGKVYGVDISKASVEKAKKIYDLAIVASTDQTGFDSNSFGCAVSLDVLGHLDPLTKKQTLKECFRVLKPGGLCVHYVELDCNNIFYRFAKRFPTLYKKYFIEQDGHINLENILQNETEFRQAGFEIVKTIPMYKLTLASDEFLKRFDNEYAQKSAFIRLSVGFCRFLNKLRPVGFIWDLCAGITGDLVGLFLNDSCAGGLFIVCKKPNPEPKPAQ
jgi:SAM-dependent methyltransferase